MAKRKRVLEEFHAEQVAPKRRSSRLNTAKPTGRIFPKFEFQPLSSFEDSSDKSSSKPRRDELSLENFKNMPLDICFEIFCHLEPLDLLILSRSVKTFGTYLRKKSSALIWATARANVHGFPPRIQGMSEIRYASLMFDNDCEGCHHRHTTAKDIHWNMQMRICSHCQQPPKDGRIPRSFVVSDMLEFEFQPPLIRKHDFLYHIPHQNQKWLPEVVSAYLAQYEEMVHDEASFQQWQLKMRAETKIRQQWHHQYLTKWVQVCKRRRERQERHRSKEIDKIRSTRYSVIWSRLLALGWEKTDMPLSLPVHPYVDKVKELTDKEWARIGPVLSEFIKTQAEEAERSKQ
ncbi:hypothetical protein BDP27DRAFT_1262172, partial [Rhodocollybia butyracea]